MSCILFGTVCKACTIVVLHLFGIPGNSRIKLHTTSRHKTTVFYSSNRYYTTFLYDCKLLLCRITKIITEKQKNHLGKVHRTFQLLLRTQEASFPKCACCPIAANFQKHPQRRAVASCTVLWGCFIVRGAHRKRRRCFTAAIVHPAPSYECEAVYRRNVHGTFAETAYSW